MSLKELKSLYDRNTLSIEGNKVGQNPPSEGNYFTNGGTNNSPFTTKGGSEDHMVALLTKQVLSLNSGKSYKPSPNASPYQDLDGNQGPQFQLERSIASQKHIDSLTQTSTYTHGNSTEVVGPTPGGDSNSTFQDLDGVDGGNGYFHGIASPGRYQGKQLGGIDLHKALLTKSYTYGKGKPSDRITVGPSPGPSGFSDFQDLNGGFASSNSTLGQFGGPYKSTGPLDGFY